MIFSKLGFSLLELIIVMSLLTIISAFAVPKFMRQQEVAFVESSAIKLLSFLELGASQSVKQGKPLHVHFIPQTESSDGCIILNESKVTESNLCDSEHRVFKLKAEESLKIKAPDYSSNLFYFSSVTGLPSRDLTLLLSANAKDDGNESGILIRRYKGLVGCSQTGILNWQLCN